MTVNWINLHTCSYMYMYHGWASVIFIHMGYWKWESVSLDFSNIYMYSDTMQWAHIKLSQCNKTSSDFKTIITFQFWVSLYVHVWQRNATGHALFQFILLHCIFILLLFYPRGRCVVGNLEVLMNFRSQFLFLVFDQYSITTHTRFNCYFQVQFITRIWIIVEHYCGMNILFLHTLILSALQKYDINRNIILPFWESYPQKPTHILSRFLFMINNPKCIFECHYDR